MSNPFRIENDVPLPLRSNQPPWPLEKLQVGESFRVELTPREIPAMRQRISRFQKKYPPKRFSLVRDGETMRVFRIEDH